MANLTLEAIIDNLDNRDYVIDEYDVSTTNMSWRVRKWASGYMEAFGTRDLGVISADGSIAGGIYYKLLNFAHPPEMISCSTSHWECVWGTGLFWAAFRAGTGTSSQVSFFGNQTNVSLRAIGHITGRWK